MTALPDNYQKVITFTSVQLKRLFKVFDLSNKHPSNGKDSYICYPIVTITECDAIKLLEEYNKEKEQCTKACLDIYQICNKLDSKRTGLILSNKPDLMKHFSELEIFFLELSPEYKFEVRDMTCDFWVP